MREAKRRTVLLLAAVAAALAAGCASNDAVNEQALAAYQARTSGSTATVVLPQAPVVVAEAGYTIGVHDLLHVSILHLTEMNRLETLPRRVGDDGSISLPFIDIIQVAGLTPEQLRDAIEERYRPFIRDPFVDVRVEEADSHMIQVGGAVSAPGQHQLRADQVSFLEALSLAGGLTGDLGRFAYVSRANGDVPHPMTDPDAPDAPPDEVPAGAIPVDLAELLEGRDPSLNIPVYPGDTVFVPRAQDYFVAGYVANPGTYPIRRSTTLLQAVGAAGGVSPEGSPSEVTLIRRQVDGAPLQVDIDLGAILAGDVDDPIIRPGDVIEVGQGFFKWAWYTIVDVFKGIFGVGYSIPVR